ncbi:MAG TPA: QueT transporter family protein [Clostridiales bacterium]|nr:QueT transporter family protein [Clostridiales bacterium]
MKKITTDYLVKSAIIAALYIAVTLVFQAVSYGQIQFRISEIFVLFAFIDPAYLGGLTLGCAIANFFSPFGLIDVVFGTTATFLALLFIIFIRRMMGMDLKSLFLSSFGPVISNGIIIGFQLNYILNLPLIPSIIFVALGEFAVVSVIGTFVFRSLIVKSKFIELITIK